LHVQFLQTEEMKCKLSAVVSCSIFVHISQYIIAQNNQQKILISFTVFKINVYHKQDDVQVSNAMQYSQELLTCRT